MFHRIFSLLLIGTTLLGSSFCCCTMRLWGAEPAEFPCCCCPNIETQDSCPAKSDGNEEHKCPCREQRSVSAALGISQILPTSPATKWTVDLSDVSPSYCCMQVEGVSPQAMENAKGDILLYAGLGSCCSGGIPRTSRASRGGFACHVLNRGNGCSDVFQKDDDFAAFVNLMREAHEKVLSGFCLMTNHFHLL